MASFPVHSRAWLSPALLLAAFLSGLTSLQAGLLVNPAQPITERVSVHVIQVADDSGANAAPLFGTTLQQSTIFSQIDVIWAQAGIDVAFDFRTGVWNNAFALTGTPGDNNPRPTGDLDDIVNLGESAGVVSPDPLAINLFLVQIVPGFSQTTNNTANGLAFVGANGITLWAGPDLTSFANGQDVIASVLAHEIGHNLGLSHIAESENLMAEDDFGERLNAAQITTALNSPYTVPIPEPGVLGLLLASGIVAGWARRASRSAPLRS